MSTPHRTSRLVLSLTALVMAACASAGPYSYARTYKPLADEKAHLKASERRASLEEVKRDPNGFRDTELGWFGVVKGMGDLPDGRTRLELSLRAHQERHLCQTEEQNTCRVTVSEKDLGTFTIDVKLKPEERDGKERIWFGSLLRVYGHPSGEYDDETGPHLNVTYYRHFPRGTYLTTASRGAYRR